MYQPVLLHTNPVLSYINPHCPILTKYQPVPPSVKYLNVRHSFVDLRREQLNFSLVFVTFFKLMFGSDLEHRVWSRFWNWNLANILRLVLTWDLTIFGNTIGNKDRGEVIARTWFHSFFSRKKSEIWVAFTFFEKWKVKNNIPSLFFEKWKWNWNGSRSRTRSENEKKFSRILEKRESRWSLRGGNGTICLMGQFVSGEKVGHFFWWDNLSP